MTCCAYHWNLIAESGKVIIFTTTGKFSTKHIVPLNCVAFKLTSLPVPPEIVLLLLHTPISQYIYATF